MAMSQREKKVEKFQINWAVKLSNIPFFFSAADLAAQNVVGEKSIEEEEKNDTEKKQENGEGEEEKDDLLFSKRILSKFKEYMNIFIPNEALESAYVCKMMPCFNEKQTKKDEEIKKIDKKEDKQKNQFICSNNQFAVFIPYFDFSCENILDNFNANFSQAKQLERIMNICYEVNMEKQRISNENRVLKEHEEKLNKKIKNLNEEISFYKTFYEGKNKNENNNNSLNNCNHNADLYAIDRKVKKNRLVPSFSATFPSISLTSLSSSNCVVSSVSSLKNGEINLNFSNKKYTIPVIPKLNLSNMSLSCDSFSDTSSLLETCDYSNNNKKLTHEKEQELSYKYSSCEKYRKTKDLSLLNNGISPKDNIKNTNYTYQDILHKDKRQIQSLVSYRFYGFDDKDKKINKKIYSLPVLSPLTVSSSYLILSLVSSRYEKYKSPAYKNCSYFSSIFSYTFASTSSLSTSNSSSLSSSFDSSSISVLSTSVSPATSSYNSTTHNSFLSTSITSTVFYKEKGKLNEVYGGNSFPFALKSSVSYFVGVNKPQNPDEDGTLFKNGSIMTSEKTKGGMYTDRSSLRKSTNEKLEKFNKEKEGSVVVDLPSSSPSYGIPSLHPPQLSSNNLNKKKQKEEQKGKKKKENKHIEKKAEPNNDNFIKERQEDFNDLHASGSFFGIDTAVVTIKDLKTISSACDMECAKSSQNNFSGFTYMNNNNNSDNSLCNNKCSNNENINSVQNNNLNYDMCENKPNSRCSKHMRNSTISCDLKTCLNKNDLKDIISPNIASHCDTKKSNIVNNNNGSDSFISKKFILCESHPVTQNNLSLTYPYVNQQNSLGNSTIDIYSSSFGFCSSPISSSYTLKHITKKSPFTSKSNNKHAYSHSVMKNSLSCSDKSTSFFPTPYYSFSLCPLFDSSSSTPFSVSSTNQKASYTRCAVATCPFVSSKNLCEETEKKEKKQNEEEKLSFLNRHMTIKKKNTKNNNLTLKNTLRTFSLLRNHADSQYSAQSSEQYYPHVQYNYTSHQYSSSQHLVTPNADINSASFRFSSNCAPPLPLFNQSQNIYNNTKQSNLYCNNTKYMYNIKASNNKHVYNNNNINSVNIGSSLTLNKPIFDQTNHFKDHKLSYYNNNNQNLYPHNFYIYPAKPYLNLSNSSKDKTSHIINHTYNLTSKNNLDLFSAYRKD